MAKSLTEREELLAKLKEEVERCVNCGFCESVCPTLPASGFRPAIGARGRVDIARFFLEQVEQEGKSDLRISDAFYSCLGCYACVHVCPAGVNAGKVSEIGKRVVASGNVTSSNQEKSIAKMIVEVTKKLGNPFGVRRECASWAEGLEFDESSDTLLYTGNMYQLMAYNAPLSRLVEIFGEHVSDHLANFVSHHPSTTCMIRLFADRKMRNVMNAYLRDIYTLLKSSGIRFNYLRDLEPYPGTLIYDFGYLDDFTEYAARVTDFFRKKGVKRIITIDPHTFDVLKNKYPKQVNDFDFEVVYFLDCVDEEQFEMMNDKVVLHEPCYVSLRGDTYVGLPRLLEKVAQVEYPMRSGKMTMCCGGPDEALFGGLSHRISEQRFSQLKDVGVEKIITACPICYANLSKYGHVEDISGFLASHAKNQ